MAPASVLKMIHLNTATLRGYRERRLPPAGLLAADEHLAGCAECREALLDHEGGASADEIIDALTAEDAHLGYDVLEAWVDDTLTPQERRAASSHLQSCAQCAADLADLRAVAASLPAAATAARGGKRLQIAAAILLLILGGASWLALRQRTQARSAAETTLATIRPIVTLHDGNGVVTLQADGSVNGIALSEPNAALVRDALVNGRLTLDPRVTALRHERGALMGATVKNTFDVLSPTATFVRETRPRFAWAALKEGTAYRVEVYDNERNLVIESPLVKELEWTADRDLARGREYLWQVVAMRGSERLVAPQPPAPEAGFAIIDAAAAARIETIAQAQGQSHLVLAVADAREGLLDDARHELDTLAALNPRSVPVSNLIRSLRN